MSEYKSKYTGEEIDWILEKNNPKIVFSGVFSAIETLDTENDYFGLLTIQATSPDRVADLKAGDCVVVDGVQTNIVEIEESTTGFFVTRMTTNGVVTGVILTTGSKAVADNDLQVISKLKFTKNIAVVDDLTTSDSTAALSAKQGKVLKEKIEETEKLFFRIPGKFRNMTNLYTVLDEIGLDNINDFTVALSKAGDTESNTTVFIIDSNNIVVPVYHISGITYTLTYLEPADNITENDPYSVIRLVFRVTPNRIGSFSRQELIPSTSEAPSFDYDFFWLKELGGSKTGITQSEMNEAGITLAVWNGIAAGRITKLKYESSSGTILFDVKYVKDNENEKIACRCAFDFSTRLEMYYYFIICKNSNGTYDETYWKEDQIEI